MDDRADAADQLRQCGLVGQITGQPLNPDPPGLRPPRQCAHIKPRVAGTIEKCLPDKPGAPGKRYFHRMTNWSRCTTAERGA